MKCVVCKSEMYLEESVMCAEENIKLFTRPHTIKYGMARLYRCPVCTHLQIENKISNDIYKEEYNVDYATWNDTKKKDKKYLQKVASLSSGHCVCEIGCGEGRTLKLATQYFDEVIGVEPAKKQALVAKETIGMKGVIINEFFTATTYLNKKIDAFYSKMVFEHLEDPSIALQRIYDLLQPGGIGWINVPNGQRIYDQNLYYLFSYVHLQYYTPFSLCTLMNRVGFEVIQVDSHEDNSEIIDIDIIVRKPVLRRGCFHQKQIDLKNEIKKRIDKKDVVTIWGAGTKSHKYINLLDSQIRIQHIVDKSDDKIGLYISQLENPIEKITQDILKQSDVIIIFATMYNYEIISELKSSCFKGKVLYFENGWIEQISIT